MSDTMQAAEKRRRTLVPSCSVREDGGRVRISLEVPGVGKDDIEIKVEKNELIVKGRSDEGMPQGSYLIRERARGDYEKVFTLDETIDRERVDAELKNGVLSLTLLLKEAAKPRRIEIA